MGLGYWFATPRVQRPYLGAAQASAQKQTA